MVSDVQAKVERLVKTVEDKDQKISDLERQVLNVTE